MPPATAITPLAQRSAPRLATARSSRFVDKKLTYCADLLAGEGLRDGEFITRRALMIGSHPDSGPTNRRCPPPVPAAAGSDKPIARLAIYTLALTRRVPGLKLFDIKCARRYASSRAIPISLISPSYSPKYLSAIWMPSSYIFWKLAWNWSPRFVLREKNSMTCAIVVRFCLSSASIFVVDPTSMRPSRS